MKTLFFLLICVILWTSCSSKSDIPVCCAKAGCGDSCIAECRKNNCTDENCCANCATEGCKSHACLCVKSNRQTNSTSDTTSAATSSYAPMMKNVPPCCAKAGCGEACIAECTKNNCTNENCCAGCAKEGCKKHTCTHSSPPSAGS